MKNNRSRIKKITFLALCASLALLLSYVEALIPPIFSAVPGIKMGLPNIVIILALYHYGLKEAATVSFVRLICVAVLFGGWLAFVYSLAGAVLSLTIMVILKSTKLFSTTAVSIIGAICHNAGQILVAILLLKRVELGYYMLILTFTGAISGFLIGLASAYLIKRIKKHSPS